jgi:hypothetical protein
MSEDLPVATHSSTLTIMGVELKVHRLDDGRAIIEAEGFHQLFEAMGAGAEMTEEDAASLARVVHGSHT